MNLVELIAIVFSLWSVYLTIKLNILCWLVGIIGIAAYAVLFMNTHLYAQAILQIVFAGQSIYGWIYWNETKYEGPKFGMTPLQFCIHLIWVFLLTLVLWFVFDKYTDDPDPLLDGITTALSLFAMWLMTKKSDWCWLAWVMADIFFVIMFMNQQMYGSVLLYFIFMFLAIKGLIAWTKGTTTV